MGSREIIEKSLEEDHFSSHTHDLERFAQRVKVPEKEAHTVPERYDLDRCALLMVNPQRLFVYWEISGRTRSELGMGGECAMRLCLMRDDQTLLCADVTGDVGSYYFNIDVPHAPLYAALVWTGEDGKGRIVLRSKPLTSAAAGRGDDEGWAQHPSLALLRASLGGADGGSSEQGFSSPTRLVPKENR